MVIISANLQQHALKNMKPWFVYILECKDGSYYTGITTDLERRLHEHQSGKGSKYVKNRGARNYIFIQQVDNRSIASRIEYDIKQLNRK